MYVNDIHITFLIDFKILVCLCQNVCYHAMKVTSKKV
jgi:hypothetical protein